MSKNKKQDGKKKKAAPIKQVSKKKEKAAPVKETAKKVSVVKAPMPIGKKILLSVCFGLLGLFLVLVGVLSFLQVDSDNKAPRNTMIEGVDVSRVDYNEIPGMLLALNTDGKTVDITATIEKLHKSKRPSFSVYGYTDTLTAVFEPMEVAAVYMEGLEEKKLTLSHIDEDGNIEDYVVELDGSWYVFREKGNGFLDISYDEDKFREFVKENISSVLDIEWSDVVIESLPTEDDPLHAVTSGERKDGQYVDVDELYEVANKAIKKNIYDLVVPIVEMKGGVVNNSGEDLGDMEFLSIGVSNFKTSGWARISNVELAFYDFIDDVVVAPGEEFSFNDMIGGRSFGAWQGWKTAKVITRDEEGQLEVTPGLGGGICQSSTTMYRAILGAGMDITDRTAHGLYVHYYTEGGPGYDYETGAGLDATIWIGSRDLKFVNNTDNYILMKAWTDEDLNAYVAFYGTDDGREVNMYGPYTYLNMPDDVKEEVGALSYNSIAWIREIKDINGNEIDREVIYSRYSQWGAPRSMQPNNINGESEEEVVPQELDVEAEEV